MTSSNGNIFRVTGPLCGEFTGHRWIPMTKASGAQLLVFTLIWAWINGWVNNREAGDLRRHRSHSDVTVMNLLWTHNYNDTAHNTTRVYFEISWWRHQMETFSALLALCAGNSSVTGEFPWQRPVTRSFDIFFDPRLNKRLSKQWRCRWFETQLGSLWRHCNVL